MPANNTPATAIDITSIPFSTTLDPGGPESLTDVPSCVGSAFSPVWYKYTVPANVTAIGLNIEISAASDYFPQFSAWLGTPGSLTEVANTCLNFYDPELFQIGLTPGETYYFQIVDGNENDPPPAGQTITFELEVAPLEIAPAGSLVISNDIANLPTCILDATDGSILRILGWPAFECAYVLPSGLIGVAQEKDDDSFNIESFTIFNQDLSVLIANTGIISNPSLAAVSPVTGNRLDTFWFAQCKFATFTVVRKIADDGTVDPTTWTLPADGNLTSAIAVNAAGTLLYYCDSTTAPSTTVGAIHVWDLVNDIQLADLVAPDSNVVNGRDLLLLDDDTLLVMRRNTGTWEVEQYDQSGSLLDTFTIPSSTGSPPRICLGLDDPDSFWVMTFPVGTPKHSIFTNILIADGSTITSLDVVQRPGNPNDEGPMFGPAQSCPLLLLPLEVEPPGGGGTIVVGKASSLVIGDTTIFTIQSPGLDPITFDITFEGTQTFENVPAGVYSIIEDAHPSYSPTYYISNDPVDNDNTAIVVADGELVDVVIVNSLRTQFGGIYTLDPRSSRKHDTVLDQDNNLVDKMIRWFFQLFIARDK